MKHALWECFWRLSLQIALHELFNSGNSRRRQKILTYICPPSQFGPLCFDFRAVKCDRLAWCWPRSRLLATLADCWQECWASEGSDQNWDLPLLAAYDSHPNHKHQNSQILLSHIIPHIWETGTPAPSGGGVPQHLFTHSHSNAAKSCKIPLWKLPWELTWEVIISPPRLPALPLKVQFYINKDVLGHGYAPV